MQTDKILNMPRNSTVWGAIAKCAESMAERALSDVGSREDWEKVRAKRAAEYRASLGLDQLPVCGVPDIREYGEFRGTGFRARKIGYELLPGCWGAATIYYPEPLSPGKLPAVLYTCGHWWKGSWAKQAHPILWARRGYICLIVDSMEQNDNPGEHNGTSLHWNHQRVALGYGSCGGEVFNSTRALDVLAADPSVDASRMGVTGISGGGAMSFFVAALDERIRAVSTLCGLCSPRNALVHRHLAGHCDCMFPINLFHRDLADVAALIAPRAALFCFGEGDALYRLDECVGMAKRARKIWELYGIGDRHRIVTVDCPHADHPDFDRATQQWFDRHVAGEEHPILERGEKEVEEAEASVFHGVPPSPNRLHLLPELLNPRGSVRLPSTPQEWPEIRAHALAEVAAHFHDLPESRLALDDSWTTEAETITFHRGDILGIEVFLETWRPSNANGTVVLGMATGGQCGTNLLHATAPLRARTDTAIALFEPRLCGGNYQGVVRAEFPAGKDFGIGNRLAKALTLLGETPVQWFVEDLRIALQHLRDANGTGDTRFVLYGRGEAAAATLLVAAMDESISGVVLEQLPGTFADGCEVIGILRSLDVPHAVGLIAPRRVALVDSGDTNWSWPDRVFSRLGLGGNLRFAATVSEGLAHVLDGLTD